ncbi:unnamed protein product [Pleuronectes platessa]|uniref:Uncharacterized protein n=1 Tax=Pleuronectes platessa TaxID=8262 RepID=A0A9N7YG94_PLEPL|nr:unnamed protein product [Pleuronectes platessa]
MFGAVLHMHKAPVLRGYARECVPTCARLPENVCGLCYLEPAGGGRCIIGATAPTPLALRRPALPSPLNLCQGLDTELTPSVLRLPCQLILLTHRVKSELVDFKCRSVVAHGLSGFRDRPV